MKLVEVIFDKKYTIDLSKVDEFDEDVLKDMLLDDEKYFVLKMPFKNIKLEFNLFKFIDARDYRTVARLGPAMLELNCEDMLDRSERNVELLLCLWKSLPELHHILSMKGCSSLLLTLDDMSLDMVIEKADKPPFREHSIGAKLTKDNKWRTTVQGYKSDIEVGELELKEIYELMNSLSLKWYRKNDPYGERW